MFTSHVVVDVSVFTSHVVVDVSVFMTHVVVDVSVFMSHVVDVSVHESCCCRRECSRALL